MLAGAKRGGVSGTELGVVVAFKTFGRAFAATVAASAFIATLLIWFVVPTWTQPKLDRAQKQALHRTVYKEYARREALGTRADGLKITAPPPSRPAGGIAAPEFLARLGCSADAIVVGTVRSASSGLTEERTFAFTDYDVQLEDILKNNSRSLLAVGDMVTVTRPGGKVQSAGRALTAKDESFLPLQNGQRYVLMLSYLPATDSYKTTLPQGAYLLTRTGGVQVMTDEGVPVPEITNGTSQFLIQTLGTALFSCK